MRSSARAKRRALIMRVSVGCAIAVLAALSPVSGQLVSTVGLTPLARTDTAAVNVVGLGEVRVPPTRAVVFVEVVSEDASAGGAAVANSTARSRVVEALAEIGFGEEQVSSWGFGAGRAIPRTRVPAPGQPTPPETFQARAGLRVVVDPASRVEEVVSAVLGAGAEGIPLVQFESGPVEEAQREAARLALRNARTSAEALAEAAGGRLGELRQLSVLPNYDGLVASSRFFTSGLINQGVQLIPSDVSVKVQVQASWAFVRR